MGICLVFDYIKCFHNAFKSLEHEDGHWYIGLKKS